MLVTTKQGIEVKISKRDLTLFRAYTWYVDNHGYLVAWATSRQPGRRRVKLLFHREVLEAPKGLEVDHKFFRKLDNRRSQLRLATHSQNRLNLRGAKQHSRTGVRGVCPQAGRFAVKFQINKKPQYLGLYKTLAEATSVAKHWLRERGLHAA